MIVEAPTVLQKLQLALIEMMVGVPKVQNKVSATRMTVELPNVKKEYRFQVDG